MISFLALGGPTEAVRNSRASEVGSVVGGVGMNEEREGPALRRSEKVVRDRAGRSVGLGGSEAEAKW